jgi:hypothetical protein
MNDPFSSLLVTWTRWDYGGPQENGMLACLLYMYPRRINTFNTYQHIEPGASVIS